MATKPLQAEAQPMSTRELLCRANALVRELSPERLRFGVEFLEFLKERKEWEATLDILTDPKMVAMIKKAEQRGRLKARGLLCLGKK